MAREAKVGIAFAIVLGLLVAIPYYVLGLAKEPKEPTSQDVVAQFKAEDLDVADSYPIEEERQTPTPKTYKEGTRFTIASLGEDKGGRVFTFESEEDMKPVQDYFEGFGGAFYSYVYTKDNILLQINGELPKANAEEYNRVLQKM